MKSYTLLLILVFFFLSFYSNSRAQQIKWYASGNKGIVAAGPASSVQAGLDMLNAGGNAIDGAVATIFNLAVADYGSFCMGGEVPLMYYNAKAKKVIVFNGMGNAPNDPLAIEWFYKNGIPEERKGIELSTVPSAISTCLAALELKGTMSFEQVIAPTLKLLDKGAQPFHLNLAATLRRLIDTEKKTQGTREQRIRAARDRFYKGDIAAELDKYYRESGAFLRKSDLESYQTTIEEPVMIKYKDYSVYKCNTWTQGPVLLQSLRLLENFDLRKMGFLTADYIHLVTEVEKLAFADRDKYYGDPAFVDVPLKQLLSNKYTKLRLPLIDMQHASQEIRPGDPVNMIADAGPGEYTPGDKGTTTCVVVDRWGNAVAATASSNGTYGICESLGFPHNTRMSTFNIQKGHPNCLEPGKKPRITLTPTIVLKNNKPILILSVAGGDMQDQLALQIFVDILEFGRMPKEAVSAPRFNVYHMEYSFSTNPDPMKRFQKTATLEMDSLSQPVLDELAKRGHKIELKAGPHAYPAVVYVDQKTGMAHAATEPLYHKVNNRGKLCGAVE